MNVLIVGKITNNSRMVDFNKRSNTAWISSLPERVSINSSITPSSISLIFFSIGIALLHESQIDIVVHLLFLSHWL